MQRLDAKEKEKNKRIGSIFKERKEKKVLPVKALSSWRGFHRELASIESCPFLFFRSTLKKLNFVKQSLSLCGLHSLSSSFVCLKKTRKTKRKSRSPSQLSLMRCENPTPSLSLLSNLLPLLAPSILLYQCPLALCFFCDHFFLSLSLSLFSLYTLCTLLIASLFKIYDNDERLLFYLPSWIVM